MKYSEKWGKDIDEAVRLALEDLKVTEDQIQVTVIEEPSKGFLGLGAKLAKVRVDVIGDQKETEEEKKKSKNANKKSESKHKRDLRKKDKQKGQSSYKSNKPSEKSSGKPYDRDRKDNKGKSFDFPEIDLSNKPVLSEKPKDLVPDENNDATVFLKDLIEKMGLDVDLESSKNDECIYIEVTGKDSRTVIGKRGQTLDSIQYLTNLVINKDREEYLRTIIDVEGYRSRREKTLESLGAKLARKVMKTGRSVKLEPMNPYERKVIHSTLQGIEGISTRSEGEEPYRRVIIEKK